MEYHLAIKKEWTILDPYKSLDESQNNLTERKKPDFHPQKEYILYDAIL